MANVKKVQSSKTAQSQPKTTYTQPEGWVPGMAVLIHSVRVEGRKGLHFTYLTHVYNGATGSEWVDVKDRQGNTWSFRPDQVHKKIVKPKRKYVKKA